MESWGRLKSHEAESSQIFWRQEAPTLANLTKPLLAVGLGRSYGDSCLIEGGTLIHTETLNRFQSFDSSSGILSCEAGMSLADILQFILPKGWFLPVSPGTKFVTLGGAIANDVHGKNHHRRGTIGRHILDFDLVRSDGEALLCSPQKNPDLFAATIGGMGLTGLITRARIQLIPVSSAWIDAEMIRTENLDEFFEIDQRSAEDFEYTVSWIDCMAKGKNQGRGIFIRGNHRPGDDPAGDYQKQKARKFTIPLDAPGMLLNAWSIKAFNELYYRKQLTKTKTAKQGIDPFFYPLDAVLHWNRLYGKAGLLQYQCVLPESRVDILRQLFEKISRSGQGSFLAVLKKFGDMPSPGLMSFPFDGYTLSLDFRNLHNRSKQLFDELDALVLQAKGRLYPAKDAMMTAATFQAGYPQWKEFSRFIDPNFQSMFWQRVTRG